MNKKNKSKNRFSKILVLLLLVIYGFSNFLITQPKAAGANFWQSSSERGKGWGETFNAYIMLNDITGEYELTSTVAIDSNKDLKEHLTNVMGECEVMPGQTDGSIKSKTLDAKKLINCSGGEGKVDNISYPYTWIGVNKKQLETLIGAESSTDKDKNKNCDNNTGSAGCYSSTSSVKVGDINAGEADAHQATIAVSNITTQLNSALRFVNAEKYANKKTSDKNGKLKSKNSFNVYKTGTNVTANVDKYLKDVNNLANAMTAVAGAKEGPRTITLAGSGATATVSVVNSGNTKKTSYPKELGLNADKGVTANQLVEITNSKGDKKVFLAKAARGYGTDSALHASVLNMVAGSNLNEGAATTASNSISKLSRNYITSSQAAYQAAYLYYGKNDDDRIPSMKSRIGLLQQDNITDAGGMFGGMMSGISGFMNTLLGVSDPGDWMLQEGEVAGYSYKLMPPDIYDLAMVIFWISAGFGVVIAVVSLQSRLALAARATGDDSILLRRQAITSFFISTGSIALFYPLFLLTVQINNSIFDAIKSQFVWDDARVTLQGMGLGGLSAMFAPAGWMMLSISVMTYGLTRMVNIFLYLVTMPILLSRLDTNSNNKFVKQGIYNLVFNIFIVNAWLLAYIFALNLQSSFQHSTTWIIIVLGVLFMGITPALKKLFNVSGGIDTGIAAAAGAYTVGAASQLAKGAKGITAGGLNKAAGHQMGLAGTLSKNAQRDVQENLLGRKDGLNPETESNLKKASNKMKAAGILSGVAGFLNNGGAGLGASLAATGKAAGETNALKRAAGKITDRIQGDTSYASPEALKEKGISPTGPNSFIKKIGSVDKQGNMQVGNKSFDEHDIKNLANHMKENLYDDNGKHKMPGTEVKLSGGLAGTEETPVYHKVGNDLYEQSRNVNDYGALHKVTDTHQINKFEEQHRGGLYNTINNDDGTTRYTPKVKEGDSIGIEYHNQKIDTVGANTNGNPSSPLTPDKKVMHTQMNNILEDSLRDTLNSKEN